LAGHERHHPLADSVSPIPRGQTPAYHMTTSDHMRTASSGRRTEAKAYGARQKERIDSVKIRDAMAEDIRDVRSTFGSTYNREMQEMLDYAKRKNYLPKPRR
jgi:predicted metal-dependent peptidase